MQNPAEKYFSYAARYGLNHLEIDLLQAHSFLETFTPKRISSLKRLSARFAVSLSLHAPYTLNLADKVLLIREANMAYLKKCIRLARDLEVTHVTTHIGCSSRLPDVKKMKQQALQRLIAGLKEVSADCRKHKVRLALENVNSTSIHNEFVYLGDSVKDFDIIFKSIKSPYIRLCLDLGHANTTEGVLAYIKNFSDKIICVHYHDNKGKYDEHLEVGKGTVPWRKAIKAFGAIGFSGPYISETFRKLKPHQVRDKFLKYF